MITLMVYKVATGL